MTAIAARNLISGPSFCEKKRGEPQRSANPVIGQSNQRLSKVSQDQNAFIPRSVHRRVGTREPGRRFVLVENPPFPAERLRVILFQGAETHSRSVLKAISWRTLGTLDTFAISWFMTGRVAVAGSIAGIEIITKIAWYYLHERVWAIVPWGRRQFNRIV
jgi:uncharacterized membrane protein